MGSCVRWRRVPSYSLGVHARPGRLHSKLVGLRATGCSSRGTPASIKQATRDAMKLDEATRDAIFELCKPPEPGKAPPRCPHQGRYSAPGAPVEHIPYRCPVCQPFSQHTALVNQHASGCRVLKDLLRSCQLSTLASATQTHAVPGGEREEQAMIVHIEVFKADGQQNEPVKKLRGPLELLVSFTEACTRTSDGVTLVENGQVVPSSSVHEAAVHLHMLGEEGQREGPKKCWRMLALQTLGGAPDASSFLDESNLPRFGRRLAAAGLCKSFNEGDSQVLTGWPGRKRIQLLPCALMLAARAHLDGSFVHDAAAANYASILSRFARKARLLGSAAIPAAKKLAPGLQLLLWCQGRKPEPPTSTGTSSLISALRQLGVQMDTPSRATSTAAKTKLAKVAKAVAIVAEEGQQAGVAFFGGAFYLPEELFVHTLSLLPTKRNNPSVELILTVPLVAKAWLAASLDPTLHKALRAPKKMAISALLNVLSQPRFSRVEVLHLGSAFKFGKTGAAALSAACPHLCEIDLTDAIVTCNEFKSVTAEFPQLSGLSFFARSATIDALHDPDDQHNRCEGYLLCAALAPFANLLRLEVTIDEGGITDLGDRVLRHLASHCPRLQELSMTTPSYATSWRGRWQNCLDRHTERQQLTDDGVIALLGGCPELQRLALGPTLLVETAFQTISDQLSAKPPKLKLTHLAVTDNPALSEPVSGAVLISALEQKLTSFSYDDVKRRERRAEARREQQQTEREERKQQHDGEKKRADDEKKREEEEELQTVRTANDSVWKSFGFQISGPKASC